MNKINTFSYKNVKRAEKVIQQPVWYLPHNLRLLQKKHRISLDTMSIHTGVSKAYLSQLISGKSKSPSIGAVMGLAHFWEMTCEDICFRKIEE